LIYSITHRPWAAVMKSVESKKSMRPVLIVLLLSLLGCANQNLSKGPDTWLFAHTASQAQIIESGTLVLPATQHIIAFTQKPLTEQARLDPTEFITLVAETDKQHSKKFRSKRDQPLLRNGIISWQKGDQVKEARLVISKIQMSDNGSQIIYNAKFVSAAPEGNSRLDAVHLYLDRLPADNRLPFDKEGNFSEALYRQNEEIMSSHFNPSSRTP
jgi:hypothetical protein